MTTDKVFVIKALLLFASGLLLIALSIYGFYNRETVIHSWGFYTNLTTLSALFIVLWSSYTSSQKQTPLGPPLGTATDNEDQRFKTVVENTPFAMVMISAEGKIEMANAKTEAIFGYSSAELLDELVEMIRPQKIREAHSKLRQVLSITPHLEAWKLDGVCLLNTKTETSFLLKLD